jgi:hypothetical protein
MATATATTVRVGKPRQKGSAFLLPVSYRTRIFGPVTGIVTLPMADSGDGKRIAWTADLVFPGLTPNKHLHAVIDMPPRAAILARDGTILAHGANRESKAPDVSAQILGTMGPIPADELAAYEERGIPATTTVGTSGLERIFDRRLIGQPGGTLLAGTRVLAHTKPRRGHPVRTTV